jgi:hypothetical protein
MRRHKAITALALFLAGAILALLLILLVREGLTKASLWATVIGFFVSTILGVAGIMLGYLTWRGSQRQPAGDVRQRNSGGVNIANSGIIGEITLPADGSSSGSGSGERGGT